MIHLFFVPLLSIFMVQLFKLLDAITNVIGPKKRSSRGEVISELVNQILMVVTEIESIRIVPLMSSFNSSRWKNLYQLVPFSFSKIQNKSENGPIFE
jgi:hypothetical protein